jgi:tRNA(His) 5'-end guanylyltransferase
MVMKFDDLSEQMKKMEVFSRTKIAPETWIILRIDGRSFSALTEKHYMKPFDVTLHHHMLTATTALMEQLGGAYAYTESDEISILFPRSWDMFNRRAEKTVSVSAGIASAAFTKATDIEGNFDSRVWVGLRSLNVIDYFRWRQADAQRCALNSWCYWTLRGKDLSARTATSNMKNRTNTEKLAILDEHGIEYDKLPKWQKNGTAMYWGNREHEGYNPITQKTVKTIRRRLLTDENLPAGDDYSKFLKNLISYVKNNERNASRNSPGMVVPK